MSILRVVSYNIHKGRSPFGTRHSLKELRTGLYGLRPDLVFLQEVQGRNEHRSMLDAQHMSLATALHMEVCYGCNAIRARTDHGNALLSRFPILDHENEDISDHRLEQRGLLHAQVNIAGCKVHCFVVHLGLFAGSRIRQIQALANRIERLVPIDAPMVIAGDFNDWSDRLTPLLVQRLNVHEVFSAASQALHGGASMASAIGSATEPYFGHRDGLSKKTPIDREAGPHLQKTLQRFNTLWRGERLQSPRWMRSGHEGVPSPRTFPAIFPWLRLDRIYQRGFVVRSARVLHGRPWAKLSDHAPLLAELEMIHKDAQGRI